MLKKGDSYIHFTKYGGVNVGQVKKYGETVEVDTDNCFTYFTPYIITTEGIRLELDGSDGKIFRIDKKLTEKECLSFKKNLDKSTKNKFIVRNENNIS